jgi:hypothetical protein
MEASASDRQSGTVKWFNDEKDYSFITPENHSLVIHHQYTTHTLISKWTPLHLTARVVP